MSEPSSSRPHTSRTDDVVRIVAADPTPTAVVRATTRWEEFPQIWRALLAEVWAFLRDADLRPGRNVMLYEDAVPNVEVGAEVSRAFVGNGRVIGSSLPAGRAATSVARGEPSPETLALAHGAVRDWCAANGHALTGVRWEIYGHWLENQDPAQFETEVYWLLAPAAPESLAASVGVAADLLPGCAVHRPARVSSASPSQTRPA